jgi:hypothetical protein
MKPQQMIKEIKTMLGVETEKVNLAQMKLENGTVLESDSFEPENEVFIVTDDERVALPVGEYDLEDGKILVIIDEGIIAEIKDAETEEQTPDAEITPVEEIEVEAEDEPKKDAEQFATKSELSEVKTMVEEIKAMIEEKIADKIEDVKKDELKSNVEPASKPIKHNPESKQTKKTNLYSTKRSMTTLDIVLSKIANKK